MRSTSAQIGPTKALRILYLVPDLTDPAVERRIAMLRAGGAEVEVAGFHRKPWPKAVHGVTPLGQTEDANLGQRVLAVGARLLRPGALEHLSRDRDVILARNLEMLVLGRVCRWLQADRPTLVYECLDIHSAMLGHGLKTKALRLVEGTLLRGATGLIVSSPAFVAQYFNRVHPRHPPVILVENKLLALDSPPIPVARSRSAHDAWRIGWFGMIRCRESLELLKALTASLPGRVEVVIRGRPTKAVFPDFVEALAGHPSIRFKGPYLPQDLPHHYGEVDFVWGMDFYEAGQNSAWLLPNRLYEGGAFDVPALAQATVETGRWLQRQGTGVVFDDPASELTAYFSNLTENDAVNLRQRARAVPRSALICDEKACLNLVETLRP